MPRYAAAMAERQRVFSGIQPTGSLHLGNYLGAIRNWVALQDDFDPLFCIVDLHALTVPQEKGVVAAGAINQARWLLAAGIDPDRSILFVQSHVPQHTELAWHMQCNVAFGELGRMTQFKDKSDRHQFVSAGLFTYPALQAADILLYDTDVVPVGDDQRQHIELTRDIATRFNSRFGETLVVPEHRIPPAGARVMDLAHPDRKMSKSADSPQGTVGLDDAPSAITKKFKRAVTDNEGSVNYDPENQPGVANLLSILAAATGADPAELASNYTQYGPLKADTAAAVVAALEPIQERHAAIGDDEVIDVLHAGARRAQAKATEVMARVHRAIGLLP